ALQKDLQQAEAALADAELPDGSAMEAIAQARTKVDAHIASIERETSDDADPYRGGTKYPPRAKVSIESFSVPIGAREVHVPVTLDRPSPNTVIAHIRVFDGDGGRAAPDTRKPVIFRPGDPLTKTATFPVKNMQAGNNVRAVQYEVPDGAKRDGGAIRITAEAGAVNEPITGGREATTFDPMGKLVYDVTGETIRFSDRGGPGELSTALPHGRTQVGNQETGYYGTVEMGGFFRNDEGLVLSTKRMDEPVTSGTPAVSYPFRAAMLSGHRTPETQFKYGSVEWVAKMPNRRNAWPALWLLPTGGWPPEIDVYEGFGYIGNWRFGSNLSTNLHGGEHLQRTFTRPAMRMKMQDFGFEPTLDTEFHRFAVIVDPQWITMFVNGVETMQYANPFKGETWFPLTNVAVKAKPNAAYDDGIGDMTLKSLKVWRLDNP
ncbi:MAG: glycoside hydrolase family 16 protein, partial [Phycisphaeraceae bacterium]